MQIRDEVLKIDDNKLVRGVERVGIDVDLYEKVGC